jgi:hypothetical protein
MNFHSKTRDSILAQRAPKNSLKLLKHPRRLFGMVQLAYSSGKISQPVLKHCWMLSSKQHRLAQLQSSVGYGFLFILMRRDNYKIEIEGIYPIPYRVDH